MFIIPIPTVHLSLEPKAVVFLPSFFEGLEGSLMWGQSLSDGAGLLGPQVQWDVLLALIELPQVFLLLLVHNNVDPGNGLAHHADL